MLINLDRQLVLAERIWGTVPVRLTECQLGHKLGILMIIPIPRGNNARLVIAEPLGIKDFLERARDGQKVDTFYTFGWKEKYAAPLHAGPSSIYLNFQNPGSAVGALILCLCGLSQQVDWRKVNPEEVMGMWRPASEILDAWEDLLLPEVTPIEQLALQDDAASSHSE